MQLYGYSYQCIRPPFSSAAPIFYRWDLPLCREGSGEEPKSTSAQWRVLNYPTMTKAQAYNPVVTNANRLLCLRLLGEFSSLKFSGIFPTVKQKSNKRGVGLRTIGHPSAEKKTGRGEVILSICWPMGEDDQEFEGRRHCQSKWAGPGWERHFSCCSLLVVPLFSH